MRTLTVFIAALSLASAAASDAQEASANQPSIIVVAGRASIQRTPDTAYVTLAMQARAKTPREAQQQNAAATNAVSNKLNELGVPSAARRTVGVRLEPEYDNQSNGRRIPRGYVAQSSLEVRVDDLARAGEIADAAVQAGATSIEGIRFDLKDRAAAEREAVRLAVIDARGRAEAAAAGAGRAIDRILKIEEGERAMSTPRPMMRATMAEAVTIVDAGSIDVTATVTVTVSMK
jgi:uncharacterized protein YggE